VVEVEAATGGARPTRGLRWLSSRDVESLPVGEVVAALERALLDGLQPERDGQRTRLGTEHGEMLLMPATSELVTGVKVVTSRPGNEVQHGLPLIQGVYVLFDGATLQPAALLDGAAVTSLRTPAVSALAARYLTPPSPARLVVFGAGVQARGHVRAMAAVRELEDVVVVTRRPQAADALVAEARAAGLPARAGRAQDVAEASLVVCATSARTPLFSGALPPEGALVVAIGSHHQDAREVDSLFASRAQVVVESRTSALREAGDVLLAMEDGVLREEELVALADVVTGRRPVDLARPRLFKGTGMPWQDLVTAAAVVGSAA